GGFCRCGRGAWGGGARGAPPTFPPWGSSGAKQTPRDAWGFGRRMKRALPPYPMTAASATAITMPINCPCDRTASAPCSMVSLILSCFSSLRERCSDTLALLNGFGPTIVTQEGARRLIRRNPLLWADLLFR